MVDDKQKSDEEIRLLLKKRKEERQKKQKQDEQMQIQLVFWTIVCLIVGIFGYYTYKWGKMSLEKLRYGTLLNATVQQISQVIDNIRMTYTIHNPYGEFSVPRLVETGFLPPFMMKNNELYNLYGGRIVIMPAPMIENRAKELATPTFKLSYQGLSKQTCIDLALLDWGDKIKGLVAVALGVAEWGADSALNAVDGMEYNNMGNGGMPRPRQYTFNVAKPGDTLYPVPFSKANAKLGCSCQTKKDNCSFALRYAVYDVNELIKDVAATSMSERKIREKLAQKIKEYEQKKKMRQKNLPNKNTNTITK